MLQKKAQGLSLNVIIIAAIALIVLVVLVMIFTGRMGGFTGTIAMCSNQGGECVTSGGCTSTVGNEAEASCDGDPTNPNPPGNKPDCCILKSKYV